MKLEKWLNVAGIFNIVIAVLMFLISRTTIIPVIFLIISGFYYRSYFNKCDPYKRKSFLSLLGIFNLLCNFVSGIIVLEVSGLIKKNENYGGFEENKSEKINGLLQLGVVLVLLSGIMIATNQTLVLSNLFKIIGLILLSMIFFFLSYVGKTYLKLDSSFKTYFILGVSFIILSFMGLYYYELLGSISYGKINYLFFYPLLGLLTTICSMITAKVLKIEKFNYASAYIGIFSLYLWFNALSVNVVSNLFIITILISLINFIYSPSCKLTKIMSSVAYILSFVLIPFNMIVLISHNFDIISTLLALVTTLNIFHLFVVRRDNIGSIISVPTLILNSLIVICMSSEILEIKVVFFQVMMIVFYFLIKLIDLESLNVIFKKTYKILFNVVFIITALSSLFIGGTASLIVTSLLFVQNIIGMFEENNEEIILEPFKSFLFIISLLVFINSKVELDIIFNLFIIEIIELIIYLLIKNNILKKIHYILYLGLIGLMSIISTTTGEIYLALISVVSVVIPLIISIMNRNEKYPIVIFTSIALILTNSNAVFSEIHYLNYYIALSLMLVYAFLNKDNNVKKYIGLFSSAILLFSLINIGVMNYDVYKSLNLIVYSYVGLLISTLIKEKKNTDLFMMIYFSIICILNIFTSSIWVFATITLITVMMAVIGFIKDFKKLKISAIILFILNLIYQLKDFWKDIPLAIYLLVIGLVLISVVVVKEIKENKN